MSNLIVRSDETTRNVEQAVRERYAAAAKATEPTLCCPVQYDTRYLEILPQELIERDYGCVKPRPRSVGHHIPPALRGLFKPLQPRRFVPPFRITEGTNGKKTTKTPKL